MFLVCSRCGQPASPQVIRRTGPGDADAVCSVCAYAQPFRFRALPVIAGASGSGKSTLALRLAPLCPNVFCLKSDILWGPHFDTPGDGYAAFRTALLRVALNVNQSRVTTALFASVMPHDLEAHPLVRYFDGLSFLILTCPDDVLAARLRARPAWRASGEEAFVAAMQNFNGHLQRARGAQITHLDTSASSTEDTVVTARGWLASVVGAPA